LYASSPEGTLETAKSVEHQCTETVSDGSTFVTLTGFDPKHYLARGQFKKRLWPSQGEVYVYSLDTHTKISLLMALNRK